MRGSTDPSDNPCFAEQSLRPVQQQKYERRKGEQRFEARLEPARKAAPRRKVHDKAEDETGHERAIFGRGQIILRDPETGVLCAGSDPRADGCAMAL